MQAILFGPEKNDKETTQRSFCKMTARDEFVEKSRICSTYDVFSNWYLVINIIFTTKVGRRQIILSQKNIKNHWITSVNISVPGLGEIVGNIYWNSW